MLKRRNGVKFTHSSTQPLRKQYGHSIQPPWPCWPDAGSILAPCRLHAGSMPVACWLHAGCMLAPCRLHAGPMPVACWLHAGCMLAPCRLHAVCMLFACCLHAVCMLFACCLGVAERATASADAIVMLKPAVGNRKWAKNKPYRADHRCHPLPFRGATAGQVLVFRVFCAGSWSSALIRGAPLVRELLTNCQQTGARVAGAR
jgi:hypothetical protein